jgi:hypothetical protein
MKALDRGHDGSGNHLNSLESKGNVRKSTANETSSDF